MNIELTRERIVFVERAVASKQYASVEEVVAQVWAIGMKEIEQSIARETELQRLQEIRDRDIARMPQEEDANAIEARAAEFVDEMERVRRRSKYLRDCFGELIK